MQLPRLMRLRTQKLPLKPLKVPPAAADAAAAAGAEAGFPCRQDAMEACQNNVPAPAVALTCPAIDVGSAMSVISYVSVPPLESVGVVRVNPCSLIRAGLVNPVPSVG